MKPIIKKLYLLVVLCVILLLPSASSQANSLPPPFQIFLRFFSAEAPSPEIAGVQLAGCTDTGCALPLHLIQYGTCDAPVCLADKPALADTWTLECASARCLFQSDMHQINTLPPYIKLIIDTGEKATVSEVIEAPDCEYCEVAWKIDLSKTSPLISLDDEFTDPAKAYQNFFLTYFFTLVVELAVAAALFWIFKKTVKIPLMKLMKGVGLANLLSYPISWLVIPSFGQFQTDMVRRTSIMVFVVVAIATIIAFLLKKNEGKVRRRVIISLIIGIPVCAVLFLIGMFAASYGNYTVHVSGLPWTVVILLAEVFAVAFEAFIIFTLLKKEITFQQSLALSIITNTASFLLGLVLF